MGQIPLTERRELGTFTDPDGLIALLRARKDELGLSNEALEEICLFARGQADKYLGPSREKAPGALVLGTLMDALGVSGALYVDPAKVARMSKAWARQGERLEPNIRDSHRVSKSAIRRAQRAAGKRSIAKMQADGRLAEHQSKAGKSRWVNSTPEQRRQFALYLHHCRWGRAKIPEPEKS